VNDPAEYARQVETYLCQKNKGHLIRVVGPAFELVRGWATSGVPLKVAFRGIDRCCERRSAKGPQRRPIRIEFCEADVLDAFDDWRRAVGVAAASQAGNGNAPSPRKPGLAAHIERIIARLANVRGVGVPSSVLDEDIDRAIRELEQIAASAPGARGAGRATIVARLSELDAALMTAAVRHLDRESARRLREEAAEEIAPFKARMAAGARERAIEGAFMRLVREHSRLPTVIYE
jgi:hypothetical protein